MLRKTACLLIILNSLFIAAAQRVISPVPGNFSNKQVLVIDNSDGAECFYSISGSDPLTSGFAYDGPVLIDSIGRANVKVTAVTGDVREEIEINYNVQESNPFEKGTLEESFIENTVKPGFFSYSFDNTLKIPSTLMYFLGDGEHPYLAGKELTVDPSNRLSRYIPCSVTDGKNVWRFVVFVSGGETGVLAKFAVPFEIKDWNTFVFTGEKLIWSIDDGEWSGSKVPVTLDRSRKHLISWQSMAYERGNPVQSFLLPAEPKLNVKNAKRGPASFSIEGDLRYRMEIRATGITGESEISNGLFTSATFDTFEGDSISGEAVFAFYCDGVYQGDKRAYFNVDKEPPLPPKFLPGNKGFYARSSVKVGISGEKGSKLFYAVSAPVKVTDDMSGEALEYDSPLFDSIEASKFIPYEEELLLGSSNESAVFYKVRSYCTDEQGNNSAISEYRVVIDEFNYYMDAGADPVVADGSRKYPYATFDQALEVINSVRFANMYVSGTFNLPSSEVVIGSNCSFIGRSDAKFVVPPEGTVIVRSASLESTGLVWSKTRNSAFTSNTQFFVLENSTVSFNDCEIVGTFAENGTAFNGQKSVIEIINSGLTVQSDLYGCCVNCVDSKLLVKNSRVSAVSQTAVNFSLNGGIFECRNSSCKVIAHLGRIGELTRTNARITDNTYTGEFDKKVRGIVPVWYDNESLMLEDKNNTSSGF